MAQRSDAVEQIRAKFEAPFDHPARRRIVIWRDIIRHTTREQGFRVRSTGEFEPYGLAELSENPHAALGFDLRECASLRFRKEICMYTAKEACGGISPPGFG